MSFATIFLIHAKASNLVFITIIRLYSPIHIHKIAFQQKQWYFAKFLVMGNLIMALLIANFLTRSKYISKSIFIQLDDADFRRIGTPQLFCILL
jgi:hypothetical protein